MKREIFMFESRSSGILLHPTSLPGAGGIGELGSAAYRFVDWLHEAGQQIWQILPLTPTGYGDSPYASNSAFAGNVLLVSVERLAQDGLIDQAAWDDAPQMNLDTVDFGAVIAWKHGVMRQAHARFKAGASPALVREWETWRTEEAHWLEDYALFKAISEQHSGAMWNTWEPELVKRETAALERVRGELADDIDYQRFVQWLFFRQWRALKSYANQRGIKIMGDVPIFVAYDSADVWANPDLFQLDAERNPTVVAGVPPDYFSATGQLWGNPHYRWDRLKAQGYKWWVERIRATLATVDIVRIDHFRGFESAWEIPAGDETAVNGRWVQGPGIAIFDALRDALGELPIVAEDLGTITPEVLALRDEAGLPGMRILQFAWSGEPENFYLPFNYVARTVVYTGTHDNDTTRGWFEGTSEAERHRVRTYTGTDGTNIAWDFIRLAMTSVASISIVPLQDVFGLGSEARINTPGRQIGNWGWRFRDEMLTSALADGMRTLTNATGRLP
jgi:4-alpha-glucanotransferase